jgi:hypothetical protein
MIIGINGKIGSGKDTVGRIIQYLTDDTVSKTVYSNFKEFDKLDVGNQGYHPWQIKKFAGKLKTIASLLTGIPVEKFEDQEFKKTYLGEEWNSPYNIPFSGPDFVEHDGGMTVRTLLQRLGTEAMRDGLHENVWVNALFADYNPRLQFEKSFHGMKEGVPLLHPKWIITDMRFPNEMEAIVKRNGITIRVVRQYSKEDLLKGSSPYIENEELSKKLAERYKSMSDLPVVNIHPSETALDDAEFDYEIINDGTIEELVEKVITILTLEKII